MSKEEGMEEQDNVFVTLKDHLVNRGLDAAAIVPGAKLLDDLDLDSLDTVELTLAAEESFSVEIPDEDLEGVATIQDVVLLVRSKLAPV